MAGENESGNGDVLDGFEQQLNGSADDATTVDTGNGHIYGDNTGLDAGIVGEQLAAQRAEYDKKINELNTAHAEKIGGVNSEMQTLKAQLDALSANTPTPAPEDPYSGKYSLSEDERAEMEPFLSGVDKRAQAAVEVGLSKMAERFAQDMQTSQNQFTKALEDLRSQVNLTNSDTKQAFEASTSSVARSYGLDLNSLSNDAEWNTFLKSPASYVDDSTFYDVLSNSIQNRNIQQAERVFSRFAETRTTKDKLTGAPNKGGARDNPQDAPDDQLTMLRNKRQMILDKGREYRSQVDARRMSAQEFQEKVNALEQLESQVIQEMQAAEATAATQQQTQI